MIDDKNAVDIRDFIAPTANHLGGLVDPRALGHGHILDLHDSTSRILGIAQELGHFVGHVLRHFVEHRLGAARRQGGQQVRSIIGVKIFDQVSQPVIRQAFNQIVLGVGGNETQDFGCLGGGQKAEHLVLDLGLFQHIQQLCGVCRMQAGNPRPHQLVLTQLGLNDEMFEGGRLRGSRRRGRGNRRICRLRFHASVRFWSEL